MNTRYADDMAKTYGETGSVYRVRVLGEFSDLPDSDSLIDLALVESAQVREVSLVSLVW